MTSSPERAGIDTLPPALSSMWRLCKLGYRHEPRLMLVAFVLSQLSALPDALMAVWLMLLGKGVLERRSGLILAAAIGLGVSATATWFLALAGLAIASAFTRWWRLPTILGLRRRAGGKDQGGYESDEK